MELCIRDANKLVDVQFGNWLIPKIQARLVTNSSRYNLALWDAYLNEEPTLPRLYDMSYRARDIILFASKNLLCKGQDGNIRILFDPHKFAPGFDRVQLVPLLKTINYGTQACRGCHIFTDTFNHFARDIDTYVRLYYNI